MILHGIFEAVRSVGDYTLMLCRVCLLLVTRPPQWSLIRDQLFEVGVASFPVVALTGLSTGMVLAAQAVFHLNHMGLASATGVMVTKSMMVEIGPILTAFMVTGRVGASMCATLGTMRVTEQIDALESMAVNPLRYLVAPRFIAGIFMMPLLVIISAMMGVIGGYLMYVYVYHYAPASYFEPLHIQIKYFDFIMGIVKGAVFGVIFVTIACFMGMRTRGGAQGVGRFTTQSVVTTYVVILAVNFFVTMGLNSFYHYITEWIHGVL